MAIGNDWGGRSLAFARLPARIGRRGRTGGAAHPERTRRGADGFVLGIRGELTGLMILRSRPITCMGDHRPLCRGRYGVKCRASVEFIDTPRLTAMMCADTKE